MRRAVPRHGLRAADLAREPARDRGHYKRLATARGTEQINALLEEIVDRFGKPPPQAQTLIDVHRLRVMVRDVLRSLGQPRTEAAEVA